MGKWAENKFISHLSTRLPFRPSNESVTNCFRAINRSRTKLVIKGLHPNRQTKRYVVLNVATAIHNLSSPSMTWSVAGSDNDYCPLLSHGRSRGDVVVVSADCRWSWSGAMQFAHHYNVIDRVKFSFRLAPASVRLDSVCCWWLF